MRETERRFTRWTRQERTFPRGPVRPNWSIRAPSICIAKNGPPPQKSASHSILQLCFFYSKSNALNALVGVGGLPGLVRICFSGLRAAGERFQAEERLGHICTSEKKTFWPQRVWGETATGKAMRGYCQEPGRGPEAGSGSQSLGCGWAEWGRGVPTAVVPGKPWLQHTSRRFSLLLLHQIPTQASFQRRLQDLPTRSLPPV